MITTLSRLAIYYISCGDCGYVGITKDVPRRMRQHYFPPFWAILEIVKDGDDGTQREQFWVKHFQSLGVVLLNRIEPRRHTQTGRPLKCYQYLKLQLALFRDSDKCILWPFSTAGDGYGQVRIGNGQTAYVHVVAYKESHPGEDIPVGIDVMHSAGCISRRCFNGNHLTLGTRKENMATAKALGRLHGPGVGTLSGEKNGRARLTPEQVVEIRREYIPIKTGRRGRGARTIAREYGVSRNTIMKILKGENWAHLLRKGRAA
jgi:hypothetical protein